MPTARTVPGLVLNVPEWFTNPEFLAWLNAEETTVMTWHRRGAAANEWSDTLVFVDPSLNGEGTNSDMPEVFWNEIIAACRQSYHAGLNDHTAVRLTNLQE